VKLVLDASLTLSWFFADEATEATENLQDQMAEGAYAFCPAHWPVEIANALVFSERRKNIPVGKSAHFLGMLNHFLITVEPSHQSNIANWLPLAREHELTAYDAAYLELAMRSGLALGSLDMALRRAATRVGVELLPVEKL